MGLINSDGNYAAVTNADRQKVDVTVFENVDKYINGVNPFFEFTTNGTFQCGEDLNTSLRSSAGGTTESIAEDVIDLAENVLISQAEIDPERHRISRRVDNETIYIKGDWTKADPIPGSPA